MARENRQPATKRDSKLGPEPFSELCRKVVLCVTEDWFALSHFRPLIAVLREVAHAVVVVTRSSGRLGEIEALGARVIDFDFRRASSNPLREAAVGVGAGAHPGGRGRRRRAPGGDEAGGPGRARPQAGAGAARRRAYDGAGPARLRPGRLLRLYRAGALRLMASVLRKPSSYLLVENPDDLALLRAGGVDPGPRFAILGGAGVDPRRFRPCRRRATTCRSPPSSAA